MASNIQYNSFRKCKYNGVTFQIFQKLNHLFYHLGDITSTPGCFLKKINFSITRIWLIKKPVVCKICCSIQGMFGCHDSRFAFPLVS